ncbi:MAG: hypothetical protein WKI04_15215 [Ferruginibacter sp.]
MYLPDPDGNFEFQLYICTIYYSWSNHFLLELDEHRDAIVSWK